MSEPYSPTYLDSLGIVYIKEEANNFGTLYKFEDNDISKQRNDLLKKQEMFRMLKYQMKKRETEKQNKKRIKLFNIA